MTVMRPSEPVSRSLVSLLGSVVLMTALAAVPARAQQGPPPVQVVGTVVVTSDRTPVQVSQSDFCNVPGQCVVNMMTVPAGQRLVVEHIALRATFSPSVPGTNAAVRLNTQFDDAFQSIALGATANTGPGLNSVDVFNSMVKLYSQGGSLVRCLVLAPNFENFLDMGCTITGYLEPE